MSLLNILFPKRYSGHQKEVAALLRNIFDYNPKNIDVFIKALTHKSFAHAAENKSKKDLPNNERLEFLGDAILDSVIAEFVYFKFKDEPEGYLTKVKSKLVNRKTLSELAGIIGFDRVLRYDNSRPINIDTLNGNAFEAIVGAMYLDAGYKTTRACLLNRVFPRFLDINKVLEEEIDFKSKLIIWAQRNKKEISFNPLPLKEISEDLQHYMEVYLDGAAYGRGKGANKKSAEQLAAKETLMLIGLID